MNPKEGVLIMRYARLAAMMWFAFCGSAMAQAPIAFIGQIMIFAGNFCPTDWVPTDGAVLQINRNAALFSILGTVYGGDGQSTFALPNTSPIVTKTGAALTQCIALVGAYPPRQR